MTGFTNTKVVPIKNGKPIKVEPYIFDPKESMRSVEELENLLKAKTDFFKNKLK